MSDLADVPLRGGLPPPSSVRGRRPAGPCPADASGGPAPFGPHSSFSEVPSPSSEFLGGALSPSVVAVPSSVFHEDPLVHPLDCSGFVPPSEAHKIDIFSHDVEFCWLSDRGASVCPAPGDVWPLLPRPAGADAVAVTASVPRPYLRPPLYPVRQPRSSFPVRQLPSSVRDQPGFEFNEISFPPLSKSDGSSNSLKSASPASPVPPASAVDVPAPSAASPSWASLVSDKPMDLKLSYIKPSMQTIDGRVRCSFPPAIAVSGAVAWENTVVGFFLDKLPFSLVNSQAHRLWGAKGLSEVLCNDNGFFFFKFCDKEASSEILNGGPWHFGGRPIFLKAWRQGLNLSKEGCKRVPIWAHFRNVPLEFWTAEGLSHIASTVGIPLHADRMTASLKRLSFARICVEIGIEDSLPNSLDLVLEDGSIVEILIDYNWVPKRCSGCMEFGHLPKYCKKRPLQAWVPKSLSRSTLPSPGCEPIPPHNSTTDATTSSVSPGHGRVLPLFAGGVCGPSSSAAAFSSCSGSGGSSTSNTFAPLQALEDDQIMLREGPSAAQVSVAQPPSCVAQVSVAQVSVAQVSVAAGLSSSPMDSPGLCSSLDASPDGSDVLSSPSSPSSTPLLARRLNLVDELEMKQGKQPKLKKKSRGALRLKGKDLSDFG